MNSSARLRWDERKERIGTIGENRAHVLPLIEQRVR